MISTRSGAGDVNTAGQWWAQGRRWLLIGASLIVIAVTGVIVLAWNWPYTPQAVTEALEDRFARTVHIRTFHKTYFPPGCVAEGVSFLYRKRNDLPALITVQMLIIRGSYNGFFRLHKRVDEVQGKGLRVLIPPPRPSDQAPDVMPLTTSTTGASITIGEITTDGALLEFMPRQPDHEPFKLYVHQLTLDSVGENGVIPCHAALLNTEPPGEIRSEGRIGPWNKESRSSAQIANHVNQLSGRGQSNDHLT
jgi:hypothetical protein